MIKASVVLDSSGAIKSLRAEGHAGFGNKGRDIACAAFSVLVRTAYKVLQQETGLKISGAAGREGFLSFVVENHGASAEKLLGVADFLITGLTDLARDYPKTLALSIERVLEE